MILLLQTLTTLKTQNPSTLLAKITFEIDSTKHEIGDTVVKSYFVSMSTTLHYIDQWGLQRYPFIY